MVGSVNGGSRVNTEQYQKVEVEFEASNEKRGFFEKSNMIEEERIEFERMRKRFHELR